MSSSFYAMRNKQTHKRKISFLDSLTYDLSLDNCFTLFFFIQCTDRRVPLSSLFNLAPSSTSRNSLIITRLADQKYPTKAHTQNT